MKRFFNRPLSPHLTVYIPQLSSLFSIWHRISIIIITFIFFLNLLFLKLLTNNFFIFNLLFLMLDNIIIIHLVTIVVLISLFYHIFNGIRHVIWDLNFLLSMKIVSWSSKFIAFTIIFVQILIII